MTIKNCLVWPTDGLSQQEQQVLYELLSDSQPPEMTLDELRGLWNTRVKALHAKPIYYRTIEELDALSTHAVIYDHDNQVWQKHYTHPNDMLGTFGAAWYLPGSESPHASADISLPARLLDDGL